MGFAAGFAAGYGAVDDARKRREASEQKIRDDEKALRIEKSKAMSGAFKDTSDHNTLMSTAQKEMSEATNVDEWNAANKKMVDASNAFTEYAKYNLENQVVPPEAQSLYSKANFGGSEPLVIAKIRDYKNQEVEVPLPQSMASNPENYALMENNKIGIAQVGEDGKIASYQPTDYSPVKFKAEDEYGKGLIKVVGKDGKPTSVSNKEYFRAKADGTPYEDYVPPKADTKVEVKVDNIMAGDDSFRINKDTATVADAQGNYYVDGKGNPFLDDKGEKVYKSKTSQAATNVESKASYNQLMSRLNTMKAKIKENPNAIGSIGSNPINFLINNAQDFINIPTEDNLTRGQLDGYASTMIATIRASSGENGVMTKDDAERIVKLIPSKNDSIDMFKQKVGILKDELAATAKIRNKEYGANATSTEDKKTLPPLDINAFKIKQ